MVLIGAGSAMFTQGLVSDLLYAHGNEGWELALVDTNTRALESIMLGGYLNDRNAVKEMVDELIEAQLEFLPQSP